MLNRREFFRLTGASGASLLFAHAFGGCASDPTHMPPALPEDPMGRWWLSGNYAPIEDEIEAFELEVEGALPPSLAGTLVRNGPNPAAGESVHWLLGDGMLHGVRLEGGRALWYRNRYIQTQALRSGMPSLASNLANTALKTHGGRLLALYEAAPPTEIDPSDLSTIGEYDYAGLLRRPMTAHPKIDPATGEMFFIGYAPFPPYVTYHVVDASGALARTVEVELPAGVMMHDFQVTERYAVLFDLPLHFDLARIAQGLPFRWAPEAGARLGLLPRDGSSATVQWFEIEPCFMFHAFNAFDTPSGRVVLEGCRLDSFFAEVNAPPASPWRWELDPERGTASEERLADGNADFPHVDERRVGREHRIAYGLRFDDTTGRDIAPPNGIRKIDRRSGETSLWTPGAGEQPDEALFVPIDGDAAEDGGVLLSMIFDANRGRSFLGVFDATRVADGPFAKVWMPRRVPFGFHGIWLPA
ncbi:MAG: carotenoid oxygenase family protein [Sandaracinaceae bacterium]|nr:carotenoid oxygenase family protein [Sandaracinaceae bacterium]